MKCFIEKLLHYMKTSKNGEDKLPENRNKTNQYNNIYDDYYDEPYDRKKMWVEHLERRYRHF